MFSSAYVWAKIISYIEEQLGPVVVSAAFDDAEVVELNEEHLIIYSASDFRRDHPRRRHHRDPGPDRGTEGRLHRGLLQ